MNWDSSFPARRGLVALAMAALALATVAKPALAQKAEPCIAGSWELSGPLAHTGLAIRMGLEVAVDEINESAASSARSSG